MPRKNSWVQRKNYDLKKAWLLSLALTSDMTGKKERKNKMIKKKRKQNKTKNPKQNKVRQRCWLAVSYSARLQQEGAS